MKRCVTTSWALCAILAFTLTAEAHPGRTDGNGGHWDRRSGTYHFHGGYSAGGGGGNNGISSFGSGFGNYSGFGGGNYSSWGTDSPTGVYQRNQQYRPPPKKPYVRTGPPKESGEWAKPNTKAHTEDEEAWLRKPPAFHPYTTLVLVSEVSDGDTVSGITSQNEHVKVRLYGIDAPEDEQPFGVEAKQFTSAACLGKTIKLDVRDIDQYGRLVAWVVLPDGSVLNERLLTEGLAHWYSQYASREVYLRVLQDQARMKKKGLWADSNPIAPWDFRK